MMLVEGWEMDAVGCAELVHTTVTPAVSVLVILAAVFRLGNVV
jgi:hypothetical protein